MPSMWKCSNCWSLNIAYTEKWTGLLLLETWLKDLLPLCNSVVLCYHQRYICLIIIILSCNVPVCILCWCNMSLFPGGLWNLILFICACPTLQYTHTHTHTDQRLMCCCYFVLGQIGDVKTAERYFQDVEKACQMTGSQPSHTTCVLMNRYVCVMHLAPPYSTCALYAAQDNFRSMVAVLPSGLFAGSCFLLACDLAQEVTPV